MRCLLASVCIARIRFFIFALVISDIGGSTVYCLIIFKSSVKVLFFNCLRVNVSGALADANRLSFFLVVDFNSMGILEKAVDFGIVIVFFFMITPAGSVLLSWYRSNLIMCVSASVVKLAFFIGEK